MQKHSIYVVKFGGSLFNGNQLRDWVRSLRIWATDKPVIVVPGGGEFANIIRRLQVSCRMDDEFAHELALGAMRQSGEALALLCDSVLSFRSLSQLETEINEIGFCLWVPSNEEFRATMMPRNWSVTSDSIALWLAIHLRAAELILLKSIEPPHANVGLWSENGFVDDYFSSLSVDATCLIRSISDRRDLPEE